MKNTTLRTVANYISDTRTLLQDLVSPYRYDDNSLLVAFNVTLLEARRLRADLFIFVGDGEVPTYFAVSQTEVPIESPFRLPIVFGIAAHAMARDQEDYQDSRATTFMGVFQEMLVGVRVPGVQGGGIPPASSNKGSTT